MTLTNTPVTTAATNEVGLFPVAYQIGAEVPGAPRMTVQLTVNTVSKDVTGQGRIGWPVNPPVDLLVRLDGEFTYMTVMPNQTHILVTLTGYPLVHMGGGGVGPVLFSDASLRMVLSNDWQSGTASLKFTADGQRWHEFDNLPVRKVALADGTAGDAATASPGTSSRILTPDAASANWTNGQLVIHASGREDGVASIRITRSMTTIFPPEFSVVGQASPAIGMFPYAVTGVFPQATNPGEIVIVSPGKSIHVPVS